MVLFELTEKTKNESREERRRVLWRKTFKMPVFVFFHNKPARAVERDIEDLCRTRPPTLKFLSFEIEMPAKSDTVTSFSFSLLLLLALGFYLGSERFQHGLSRRSHGAAARARMHDELPV